MYSRSEGQPGVGENRGVTDALPPLNFPREYEFDVREDGERTVIFDTVRRQYVQLTPEEWVRQNLLQYLFSDLGYPKGLTAVEKGFSDRGILARADVVVHDRHGNALLMAECKAPEVKLRQNAVDQVARYNAAVGARYLVVTNGLDHYCWVVDRERKSYRFLEQLPSYDQL